MHALAHFDVQSLVAYAAYVKVGDGEASWLGKCMVFFDWC